LLRGIKRAFLNSLSSGPSAGVETWVDNPGGQQPLDKAFKKGSIKQFAFISTLPLKLSGVTLTTAFRVMRLSAGAIQLPSYYTPVFGNCQASVSGGIVNSCFLGEEYQNS